MTFPGVSPPIKTLADRKSGQNEDVQAYCLWVENDVSKGWKSTSLTLSSVIILFQTLSVSSTALLFSRFFSTLSRSAHRRWPP